MHLSRKSLCFSLTTVVATLLIAAATVRAQQPEAPAEAPPDGGSMGAPAPARQAGVSEVRIVRLSEVKGEVQLDRKTGHGFETAFANLPIAQGQRLTTKVGVAEVEFEDNSSLRLTPNSEVEFTALARTAGGATLTTVRVVRGTLYASLSNTKNAGEFTLIDGPNTITLTPSSHIRLDVARSALSVLNGNVQVANGSSTMTVGKKKTLELNTVEEAANTPPVIEGKVEHELFDEWDKNSADFHKMTAVPAAYAGSSYVYGINDLNYYGSFTNVGGCGMMWRPYFTSASWDPYANGVWAWYPGSGYSWVSPYPWGWTPFHSGSWNYCAGGGGWGWTPGGQWNGLLNHPAVSGVVSSLVPHHVHGTANPQNPHAPATGGAPAAGSAIAGSATAGPATGRPAAPARAPAAGSPSLVVVSTRPLPISKTSAPGTFTFQQDSAGLGVPRESLGRLNRISQDVAQHGSVSTPVGMPQRMGNTPVQVVNGFAANGTGNAPGASNGNQARGSARQGGAQGNAQGNTQGNTQGASHSGSNSSASGQGSGNWSRGGGGGGNAGGGSSHMSAPAPSSGGGSPAPAGNHR